LKYALAVSLATRVLGYTLSAKPVTNLGDRESENAIMKIRLSNFIRFLEFNVWILAALVLAIGLIAVRPVHAQYSKSDQAMTMMDTTFNLKFMLGLGGEAEVDYDIDGAPALPSVDDDLEPTLGGGLEIDFPLHKFFLLGGMFSFHAWNTDGFEDADFDRSFFLDFSLVPKGRFPFEKTPLAIYLGVPIGFSLDLFDEDNIPFADAEIDVGLGMNVSVLVGAQVNLASYFGLMLELGYTYHYASHDAEIPGLSGEIDGELEQFALNLGFYFM
jgi:hypothetical protein